MFGFEVEQAGPVPAVVFADGRPGFEAERPDGGPATLRVEVEPVRPARWPCKTPEALALLADIYFHASRLGPLMDRFHAGDPWCLHGCEDCAPVDMSCELMGYLEYQVRLVKQECEQLLAPDVRKAADARGAVPAGRTEAEPAAAEPQAGDGRRPCENDLHLAVIYRHAAPLKRAMLAYAEADPPDACECMWCKDTDYAPWYFERLALVVEMIEHTAEMNLPGSVSKRELDRADALDRDAERWTDAEQCAKDLRALADPAGGLTIATRIELLRIADVLELDWRA